MPGDFENLSERILKRHHYFQPTEARYYIGLHEYDGVLPDYSKAGIETRTANAREDLKELAQLDRNSLASQQQFDLEVLRHELEATIFNLSEKRDWEKSPMFYQSELDLLAYTTREYAPLAERVAAINRQQQQTPAFIEAARANLKPPFGRPVMEMGLMLLEGSVRYRRNDIAEMLKNPELPADLRSEGEQANEAAINAIQGLLDWLKSQEANYTDNFALGRELYEKLLKYDELVDMPLEDVLAAGETNLEQNYGQLLEVAHQIDPVISPYEVVERMAGAHPKAEELISYAQNMLERIRQYVIEKDLITIPTEVRPVVAPTPPPARFGFASMAPAGAYEKSPENYYYMTLPEDDWSAERKEDWLRMFGYNKLEMTSIHEVYPGHFVHFMHIHNAPSKVSKHLLGSPVHFEGWAHYTEQMMLEEGYGDATPELKMAQLIAALWRNCRYVASIKMHTQGMTVPEAIELFKKYVGMAEGPARAEVLRGAVQPGYFSYTMGKLMFLKLREDLKKRDGAQFDLKAFHDACVGHGAPPVPLLRRLLLGEESGTVL
ncbi:MAG TPA: DUF885 domain-containing protein [Chloroflexia bacterium]|nr:DUF885 domain-containing protein [Chloroflexia bacterium]